MLHNTSNKPSKFRTKNWIDINDRSREEHNTVSDIKFNTTILKSSLCDYNDAYILVKQEQQLLEQEILMEKDKQMKEMRE